MSRKANYSAGASRGNRVSVRPSKSDIKRDKRDLDNLGKRLGLSDADFDEAFGYAPKQKVSLAKKK